MQLFQVAESAWPPALIQLVVLTVKPEERSEERRIQETHERVDLIQPVLDRSTCQDERVSAAQPLDRLARLRIPILDPLRFVEDDHIRFHPCVHVRHVRQHLLIVHDREKRRDPIDLQASPRDVIGSEPLSAPAKYQLVAQLGELLDLLLPFRF